MKITLDNRNQNKKKKYVSQGAESRIINKYQLENKGFEMLSG